MIVIDVGCAKHGSDESIPHLERDYQPSTLFGFDPAVEEECDTYNDFGTRFVLMQRVAWTYDGTIGFTVAGLGGHVDPAAPASFACVDLARFVMQQGHDEIVLKIDAEGAEYTLLPHLAATGADKRLKLLIVEWHCEHCGIGGNGRHREGCKGDHAAWEQRRADTEALMSCELAEWNL